MAKYADFPQEAYVALQHIREAALVRFDSLFTPEKKLWRLDESSTISYAVCGTVRYR